MMKRKLGLVAAATAALVVLAGCSATPPADEGGKDITLWVMGGDTPDALRDYLKTEYASATGGTLTIEQQDWSDALSKLTTALPDPENTPDVVEIGNTWSPTFTSVGAFSDITDLVPELGGDKLLPSFVEIGKVDGANYALPYYFGSRYMFYRKDVWAAAGLEVPTTLSEFSAAAAKLKTDTQSGFYIGGEDWRNGISWIFANGGDLAKKDGDTWKSTLSDPKTIAGLEQLQALYADASLAPVTEADSTPWVNINNNAATGAPEAATIIAPGWAHWSIGDLAPDPKDDTKTVATWNDDVFGTFVLPGVDGGAAPVFAGGSNIAISAASKNQSASRELMKIIFSADYQKMLGQNGLGPANLDYADSLGDDQFAKALVASAADSKLTPAAPGWAAVEGSGLLEEFFGKVNGGGDIKALAAEYDTKIDALING
ncbi:MAG TPA: extracellular solute-binding protein [Rhodoglobus sp.]|jgi:N,N'-diacetylchitobiose transport system substrate-binding protein|nr:extracellular solute-binding protein [Rhodoglobus sp.]HOT33964.1 extracellular solute-binding protein [Rhodoglobus sp.]HOW00954.1 extracellular solute-binding protein [Rhodoglobus sp.]HOY80695.1 extracellular solute-binding protein [Rhodoglobus sp.]HPG75032.1 extracellular solute-binding protein [Rhodoglobus sp.]